MFASIRRHQKWLWIVVSTLTIISFVWYFSPQAKLSGGREEVNLGSINGRAISREEYQEALQEAHIRFRVYYGTWPDSDAASRRMGFNAEQEVQNRLLLSEKIRDLNVHVSDEAVADWIATAFRDRAQRVFNPEAYQRFLKDEFLPHGVRESDLHRFARREVGIQHLMQVGGLSGRLVVPSDAEAAFRQQNEQALVEAVVFSATNYIASVTNDAAAVGQFFTNRMGMYRLPERIQVSYVQFDATNFLAAADKQIASNTNIEQAVEQFYQQRGTNFYKDAEGKIMSAEAAKAKIKEEARQETALRFARKDAGTFADELFALPPKPESLDNLAAAKGLVAKTTEPFDQSEGPRDLKVLATFTQAAFKLTKEEPFSVPLVDTNAVYVIALKTNVPTQMPPFDSVREKVTEDWRNNQAIEAARHAGTNFYSTLTNGLAQGKTFDAACDEAKISPIKVPPFARNTQTLPEVEKQVNLSQLKDLAFGLTPGNTSKFTYTRDGGFIVNLQSRLPVDEAKFKTEFPDFLKTQRRSRQYEAFVEWFQKEKERMKINLPGSKRTTR